MKKNVFKYFLSLFFIFLLFAKDIVLVFPSLILTNTSLTSVQIDWTEEESERNRSGEEVARTSGSEYLHDDHTLMLAPPVFSIAKGKNLPVNSYFKQTFYGSVATPPPDNA